MSVSYKFYESNANWFQISKGSYDYFITYGTDRQRSMSRLINGITEDILQTKYYAFGDYEKEITPTGTRHLHYISGGDGLAAIYVKYSNAPDSLYFITTDHLGSLVGAINSATGTVYRQNFDAWGRKRNPQTWSYSNIPDFPFDRGYTGHEHLKWFGLINMNGRMYDAALCRFLSPDPFVQHPGYSQSYNRYTYCLNNPLKYTDPSGYTFKPNDWDAPVVSYSYYFGPGYKGGLNGLQPVYSEPSGNDGFIPNIHEGKGVHYDPGNGHYYDNEGNIISSQQALNYYSSNQLEVTWLFFSGTEQNPYQTLTGAEFSDNSSVYFFDGNASGGGGVNGLPEDNFLKYSVEGTSIWVGTVQTGFDAARKIQPAVSTWIKGAKVLGKTSNYLGGISILYDFATGTANFSTVLDGIVLIGSSTALIFGGLTLAPYLAAGGVVYGVVSISGGEAWLNRNIDISGYINIVKPSK